MMIWFDLVWESSGGGLTEWVRERSESRDSMDKPIDFNPSLFESEDVNEGSFARFTLWD